LASTTTAADSFGRLRRILGVGFGLAVNIGSMIGVGILRAPGLVAGHLHTVAVIFAVWILGGLYTLVGASCLTELGALLPQAGGYYVLGRPGQFTIWASADKASQLGRSTGARY